jgi:hypothetical protein
MKEFFLKLFKSAAHKGVKVFLPVDFIVATKQLFEDEVI